MGAPGITSVFAGPGWGAGAGVFATPSGAPPGLGAVAPGVWASWAQPEPNRELAADRARDTIRDQIGDQRSRWIGIRCSLAIGSAVEKGAGDRRRA